MFDIGFSELVLLFVVGLIVLGPQRLPVAVRTVMGWVRTVRSLATNVQNELSQELKLKELQESIKKAEDLNISQLSPELSETVEELRQSAQKIKMNLEEKAAETNSSVEEQVQELKSAVQNSQGTATTEIEKNLDFPSGELSPAELAELAEEGEPMLELTESDFSEKEPTTISSNEVIENSKEKV
ncbi:Sec-independent protein translocase protein TatB [Histophilus somni]|uniref:Sec-independent protein translocase protein TatB n=1 Tax=Histophilus somni TaxID=731 RepID=A0AAX2S0J4_HISSO|nr:Sec-independent protein translocase protein TatB [Histophilus somni]ACA31428.1 twin-arginine translocation protein, TatB subunit [Histophilus somni 2336]QEH12319.1 Sec-independent protein translocase subunit TatB [Histophilus somni]QEH18180.1 Sec-independent protein translocase subunit TatB [Histophilus somni]QEH25378.1 Sec-independent protein translocase subunit TatB [Histophilus somni]QQF66359.1 Sec-independent protein translocase subunit TatB [Histophilus somni]